MRHNGFFAVAAMLAVMVLSGCGADTPADKPAEASAVTVEATTAATSEVTTSAEVTATTTAVTEIDPEDEKRRKYAEYGLDPDIDYYLPDGSKLVFPPVEEWSEEYWMQNGAYRTDLPSGIYSPGCYYMNGSTFIRFCTGESYDDANYPEYFGDEGISFTKANVEWKKVSVGDKVGSLTADSAFTMFGFYFCDNDDGSRNWIWTDVEADFSGSVTLEGYFNRFDKDMINSGLCFYPLPDSLKENDFPMLSDTFNRGGLCYYYDGSTMIKGDTVEIDLEYSDDAIRQSVYDILEDGDAVRVKATLSDIKLNAWIENAGRDRYCTARITDYEIVK
jgi:hypothetical protein